LEQRLINNRDTRAVLPSPQGIWLATTGGLLRKHKGSLLHYTNKEGIPAGPLHALLLDTDGSLWVGGDTGLVQIRASGLGIKIIRKVPVSYVRDVARFGGRLYIGTWGQGLKKLKCSI